MEMTIIHGQAHHGSTYHFSEMLKNKLVTETDSVHEFFLPLDGPDFCVGCFRCIQLSERQCPHAIKAQKIADAMLRSQVILIDSPTYCYEMSGQLKTMFDHFGYQWMPHRPRKEMFGKVGIAISTAAGAGAATVTKSIARQFFWWGVPKVHRLPLSVNASSWDDVSEKTRTKMEKMTDRTAAQVKREIGQVSAGLKTRILFNVMRLSQKKNDWNAVDRAHWEMNGWLGSDRPWWAK